MGRDALFNLLAEHGPLVRRRKRIQKTNSSHGLRPWPNLMKDLTPTRRDELWVCDITYWKIDDDVLYIHFITDAYSHKILSYEVSETLAAIHAIKALQQAISTLTNPIKPLIHHSDRWVQYGSDAYVKHLQSHHIQISMTEK